MATAKSLAIGEDSCWITDPHVLHKKEWIDFPKPNVLEKIGDFTPRKDSLIIAVDIRPLSQDQLMFKLKKVPIENGSSVDVVYLSTTEKLSIPLDDLHRPLDSPFGFSGEQVWLVGLMRLPFGVAGVKMPTLFHVVNANNTYNDILDRTSLDNIKIVSSPLHRCFEFYGLMGRYIAIRADSMAALECNL